MNNDTNDSVQGLLRCAKLCTENEDWNSAANALRSATKLAPDNAGLWFDYGVLLQNTGQSNEAARAFDTAVCLRPSWNLVKLHLARSLWGIDLSQAENVYRNLLGCLESNADVNDGDTEKIQTIAAQELGTILMTAGKFPEAWSAFEWRFANQGRTPLYPGSTAPVWDGRQLDNEVVMVWAEQGLGDHLQFSRFAKTLHQMGARVWLQAPESLIALYQDLPEIERVINTGEVPLGFDWQIPIMSIPGRLATTLESMPFTTAYLAPPERDIRAVERIFNEDQRPKVGFVWASKDANPASKNRDIDLDLLLKMAAKRPNEQWVSLQYGHPIDSSTNVLDMSEHVGDFARTAAFVDAMDIIVTVDTAMSHLTGALGKRCFTLLNETPDWRWCRDTEHSPWYSNHTLLRQHAEGDWGSVMQQLERGLDDALWAR